MPTPGDPEFIHQPLSCCKACMSIWTAPLQICSEGWTMCVDRVLDQRVTDVVIPMDDSIPERYRPATIRQASIERWICSQSDSQRPTDDLQALLGHKTCCFIAVVRGDVLRVNTISFRQA